MDMKAPPETSDTDATDPKPDMAEGEAFAEQASETPFRVSGLLEGSLPVLHWHGAAPTPGLEGFHLYKHVFDPEGEQWKQLNTALLPLEGMFADFEHQPLAPDTVSLFDDITETDSLIADPRAFAGFADFLAGQRFCLLPQPPRIKQDTTPDMPRYKLVGVYYGGRSNGAHSPVLKQAWTEEKRKAAKKRVDKALKEIKKRGLVKKLKVNTKPLSYEALMKLIEIEVIEKIDGAMGRTQGNGLTEDKKNLKSHISLNGAFVLALSDEALLELIIHELAHALIFSKGMPAWMKLDLRAAAIFSTLSEIIAYSNVWALINSKDIKYEPRARYRQIFGAMRHILDKFRELNALLKSGGALDTPAPGKDTSAKPPKPLPPELVKELENARQMFRALLKQYKAFLETVPKSVPQPEFPNQDGKMTPLIDTINTLLDTAFKK